jgi:hypothetical protein
LGTLPWTWPLLFSNSRRSSLGMSELYMEQQEGPAAWKISRATRQLHLPEFFRKTRNNIYFAAYDSKWPLPKIMGMLFYHQTKSVLFEYLTCLDVYWWYSCIVSKPITKFWNYFNLHFFKYSLNIFKNVNIKILSYLKSTIVWDITPWSPLKVNRSFGGTYRLHLQGRRISRGRNQPESRWQWEALLAKWFHAGFFLGLFFDLEDGGDMFLRNFGSLSTDYTALYPRR